MTITLTEKTVPLKALVLHPENVRARSPETYESERIAGLADSIEQFGLFNPLIVQELDDGTWGVLAGGRRLAALKLLATDKTRKGFANRNHTICREIPKNCDHATALSFAENDTFEAMNPIDEFDAFAKMIETGMTPADISKAIGDTEAKVRGRLRYALVDPTIREAARKKEITLDAMQAFATHPDPAVQRETYDALLNDNGSIQTWRVRELLRDRGTKVSDRLGQLIHDAYRERGGETAGDLLPEHSILTDDALVKELLLEKLTEAAKAAQEEHGFAWSDTRLRHDWQEMHAFERVYPGPIEVTGKDLERLDEITNRLAEIETLFQAEATSDDDYEKLEDEYTNLNEEVDQLQEAYSAEDLARSGVIASWDGSNITITLGLVRPEDAQTSTSGKHDGGSDVEKPIISNSLATDLATERAVALGAALCADHALAEDFMRFKAITDILGRSTPCTYRVKSSTSLGERPHGKPDDIDTTAGETLTAFYESLDLTFLDATTPLKKFEAFRKLKPTMKAKLVTYAMTQAIGPALSQPNEKRDLFALLEPAIMPNVRDYWRPTGGAFFGRLKKDDLVSILKEDLGMPDEALNLASGKKSDAVDFLDQLFAEPYATLTPEQLEAVKVWAPEGMQTKGGPKVKTTKPKGDATALPVAAE